jgi:CDP-glycerol glycerophosphotransferase (TagB/SpsB family)
MLGIRPDQIAVLYAPTWREDRTEMVTFLDVEKLMAELGDRYVLLLRGHSRTMDFGADLEHPGVIDVTSYPDIADLFLAADALITDYSSVMFDFSVTGRPMIFFVPDIDQYRDSLRGLYFDLAEAAPGPVLSTQDEVADAVRSMGADTGRYADRYQAWLERFNPYDDGNVSKRVIDRLVEGG